MDYLDQEDDEEQKRKTIGKPISPVDAPIGKPIAPATVRQAPMDAPSIQGTMPQTDSISGAGPIAPKANPQSTDAGERLTAKLQQGPPQYHGLTRVADAIGGATNIGRRIEAGAGIGTYGYDAGLERAKTGAGLEAGQTETAQKQKEQDVKTAGEEQGNVEQTIQTDGGALNIPTKNIATPTAALIRGNTAENVAGTNAAVNLRKQGLNADGTPIPQDQLTPREQQDLALGKAHQDVLEAQTNLDKFRSDPNSPIYNFARQRLALAYQAEDLRRKEFGYNYEPSTLNPEERNTLPTDVSGNPVALHSPLKPSGQTITAAYRAQNIVSQIPRLTQEIQQLSTSIGPIAGRWSQFWQGDVGAADPQFAHLKDDMDFAASAIALAHSQGRLSNIIAEKFDNMYQAGKQDPKNMIAAMQVAAEWLPKVMQNAQTVGEQASPASGQGAGAGAPPPPPNAPAAGGFAEFKAKHYGK